MKYCFLFVIFVFNCNPSNRDKRPYYLAYELSAPIEFADGQITTTNGICFSTDGLELYTSKATERRFENDKEYMGIFKQIYENEQWGDPQTIDLGVDIDAYHPILSYDNNMLLFNSRSQMDSSNVSVRHNIWFSIKNADGWSLPRMLDPVNSENYDSYPSIARNGNLYFNSDRPGGKGGMDIYASYFVNGAYQVPINIQTLNTEHAENDLVVDPGERFIILNRYDGATNGVDLYIAFRHESEWSKPIALNKINSSTKWELTPSLGPDGKYFFYELDHKIMQIDLAVLINAGW